MLRTPAETYKVAQMRGPRITPWRSFCLATLGGARALGLDDRERGATCIMGERVWNTLPA